MQAVDSKVDGWNTYILTLIIYLTLVFTLIPTRPSTLNMPSPFCCCSQLNDVGINNVKALIQLSDLQQVRAHAYAHKQKRPRGCA